MLFDVGIRATPHGSNGRFDSADTGEYDHGDFFVLLADVLKYLNAIHVRQNQIEQNEIIRLIAKAHFQCFPTAPHDVYTRALRHENCSQVSANGGRVIYGENTFVFDHGCLTILSSLAMSSIVSPPDTFCQTH